MMKKTLALLLALVLVCTAAVSALAEGTITGGWEINTENPTEIPDDVRSALSKALEGFVGSSIEPVAYLASQVVSGMNYCLLCKITPAVLNPIPSYALVYVYQDLAGNAQLMRIADLQFSLNETDAITTLPAIGGTPVVTE